MSKRAVATFIVNILFLSTKIALQIQYTKISENLCDKYTLFSIKVNPQILLHTGDTDFNSIWDLVSDNFCHKFR